MRNEPLPLTGPDCFLRAVDRETRTCSGASHLSQLVLHLDALPEAGRIRSFFRRLMEKAPLLTARIERPWGIGPPVYRPRPPGERTDVSPVSLHESPDAASTGSPDPFRRRLNDRFDLREGHHFHVDLVVDSKGGRLALTWSHMLLDGAGSEAFVRLVARAWRRWTGNEEMPDRLKPSPASPLDRFVEGKSWGERLRLTRTWGERMSDLAEPRPGSLAGTLSDVPQNLTWTKWSYPDRSPAIRERARRHAGVMRPMLFYLAVSLRAHHRVLRARGDPPDAYLVPVPVDMRRGGSEPIFRTHVSFLWFQAPAEVVPEFEPLIDHLRRQRKAMVREGLERLTCVALHTLRWMPSVLYRRMIRRPFGGEMASFFFSYTGDFLPDLEEFLGGRITDGYHVPSVPASPGSGLIWNHHRGCLQATHVHQDGMLSDPEQTRFRDQIREDLLGELRFG